MLGKSERVRRLTQQPRVTVQAQPGVGKSHRHVVSGAAAFAGVVVTD
jgi:hypothetical protein